MCRVLQRRKHSRDEYCVREGGQGHALSPVLRTAVTPGLGGAGRPDSSHRPGLLGTGSATPGAGPGVAPVPCVQGSVTYLAPGTLRTCCLSCSWAHGVHTGPVPILSSASLTSWPRAALPPCPAPHQRHRINTSCPKAGRFLVPRTGVPGGAGLGPVVSPSVIPCRPMRNTQDTLPRDGPTLLWGVRLALQRVAGTGIRRDSVGGRSCPKACGK